MKKILYIDFDGVILDTITPLYEAASEKGIDVNDSKLSWDFFANYDWQRLIEEAREINDSIAKTKQLYESDVFNIAVLTHVYSLKEATIKAYFMEQKLPFIPVISIPKHFDKTDLINPYGSILVDDYSGNLNIWKTKGGIGLKFTMEKENDVNHPTIQSLDQLLNIFADK